MSAPVALWIAHRVATPDVPLTGDAAAHWIADLFGPLRPRGADADRIGVYLATSDAGASASITLWHEAIVQSPAFADPGLFPWTLASSAAAFVALSLDVRGPVHALVGDDDAVAAALEHAVCDLARGRVDTALVGAFDAGIAQAPGTPEAAGVAARLGATGDSPLGRVEMVRSPHDVAGVRRATAGAGGAAPALRRLCEAVERGESLVVGGVDDGLVVVRAGHTPSHRKAG